MAEKDLQLGEVEDYKPSGPPRDELTILDAEADEAERTKVYKVAKFKGMDRHSPTMRLPRRSDRPSHMFHSRLLHYWSMHAILPIVIY